MCVSEYKYCQNLIKVILDKLQEESILRFAGVRVFNLFFQSEKRIISFTSSEIVQSRMFRKAANKRMMR